MWLNLLIPAPVGEGNSLINSCQNTRANMENHDLEAVLAV